jgi:hypothetical protein
MTRVPNNFFDPATGDSYNWAINHNDETGSAAKGGGQGGLETNYTISAPTSLGIFIRQQAANDPMSFSWKGTALTRAQHQQFLIWFEKCQHNSIILTDFSGDSFEVLITAYIPVRKMVAQNRNDMANARTWVYDFQIDFDVIATVSGDYTNAGIAA